MQLLLHITLCAVLATHPWLSAPLCPTGDGPAPPSWPCGTFLHEQKPVASLWAHTSHIGCGEPWAHAHPCPGSPEACEAGTHLCEEGPSASLLAQGKPEEPGQRWRGGGSPSSTWDEDSLSSAVTPARCSSAPRQPPALLSSPPHSCARLSPPGAPRTLSLSLSPPFPSLCSCC